MATGTIAAPDPADLVELQRRLDRERLDAAQIEWERFSRIHRVLAVSLRATSAKLRAIACIVTPAREIADTIDGVAEHLEAGPIASPRSMQAERELAALRGGGDGA